MNLCPRRVSNANLLESEATAGIEPAMKVLQTSALPLGYVAMTRRASLLALPADGRNEVIGPIPVLPRRSNKSRDFGFKPSPKKHHPDRIPWGNKPRQQERYIGHMNEEPV